MTGYHGPDTDATARALLRRARSAIVCPCGSRLHVAGMPADRVRPYAKTFFAVHGDNCLRRRRAVTGQPNEVGRPARVEDARCPRQAALPAAPGGRS